MNLDTARAISDAMHHRDAIPGLEVIERPLMPFEAAVWFPTPEQIAAFDETMEAVK